MSLESQILKLTEAVIQLSARLDALAKGNILEIGMRSAAENVRAPAIEPEPDEHFKPFHATEKPSEPQAKPEQAATPQPERAQNAPELPVLDHQALADMCMTIVKKDRCKGPEIKAILATFGGAKVVANVPADDLPALKAKLENLL